MDLQEFKEKMKSIISKAGAYYSVSVDPDEIVLNGCGIDYEGYLTIDDRSTPFKISNLKNIRYHVSPDEGESFFTFSFEDGVEFTHYYEDFGSKCFTLFHDGKRECLLNLGQVREIMGKT